MWECHFCITISLAHRFVTSHVQIVFHLYSCHQSSAHVEIVCIHMHFQPVHLYVGTSCNLNRVALKLTPAAAKSTFRYECLWCVVCKAKKKKKLVLWMAMPISCLNLFVCLDATKREDGTRRWGSLKWICLQTLTFGSEELSGWIVKKRCGAALPRIWQGARGRKGRKTKNVLFSRASAGSGSARGIRRWEKWLAHNGRRRTRRVAHRKEQHASCTRETELAIRNSEPHFRVGPSLNQPHIDARRRVGSCALTCSPLFLEGILRLCRARLASLCNLPSFMLVLPEDSVAL